MLSEGKARKMGEMNCSGDGGAARSGAVFVVRSGQSSRLFYLLENLAAAAEVRGGCRTVVWSGRNGVGCIDLGDDMSP